MKKYAILTIFLATILAIVVGRYIDKVDYLIYFFIVSVVVFILSLILRQSKSIALLCIIFSFFSIYTFFINIDPYVEQTKNDFVARVVANVKKTGTGASFIVDNIYINGKKQNGRAYCNTRHAEALKISDGAIISFTGKKYFPKPTKSRFSFNFNNYLKTQNIKLAIKSIKDIKILNENNYEIADLAYRIRENIGNVFFNNLSKENAVLAKSLLVLQKDNTNNEFRNMFSKMGIAHIFSVSGLHVSIVSSCIFFILKKFHMRKLISSLIAIILLGLYCYITGFSPATQRAFIMFLYLMLAHNLNKQYQTINALAISGIIILFFNPLLLFTQSFIFSYTAVLGIYLFDRPLSSLILPKEMEYPFTTMQKIRYILTRAFSLSISAQLGILIPTIYFYGEINLLSIIFNILLVPIISAFILPLTLLSLCLSFVPVINKLIFTVLNFSLSMFLQIIKLLNSSIFISIPRLNIITIFGIILSISVMLKGLFVVSFRRKILVLLSIFLVIIISNEASIKRNPEYVQLSVGKADCAIIHSNKKAIIVDLGETGYELVNFIKAYNLQVEDVYISHADKDHYGGLEQLLVNNVSIKNIYIANGMFNRDDIQKVKSLIDSYAKMGCNIVEIANGYEKNYENIKVKAIYPKYNTTLKNRPTNDNSLVMLIDIMDNKLLTTGDIPKNYEKYAMAKCDILKVAHHGSNTSSSYEFLKKCDPRVALISGNNDGFPSKKVINRLKNLKIQYFNTADLGDIRIYFDKGKYRISY